jgi:subtilase family protein/fervidolysin-like protein
MDRNRRKRKLPILVFAVLACVGASPAAPAPKPASAAPGEILVGFRNGVSTAEQNKILAKIGAKEKRNFKRIRGALLDLKPDKVQHALDQLRADDRVRYAEPNELIHLDALPNDPFFNRLWGLNNTGQTVQGLTGSPDADIDAPEAWDITTGSNAVTVAVVDTGVDGSHPDLASQMWINSGENCSGCRTDGIDNDGNGYVDDWRGWDFVNDDNNPTDDHGHGTHVAGTIGASGNNGVGVTGVNWQVRLMPLKVLSAAGSGTTADAVSAVLYAADKGADVMNNSWGGDTYSQALADAIAVADDHNSLFVAAAGNSSNDNDASPDYPSSYANPNVIAVAATEHRDALAWFSSYGRRSVDLGAPGLNIYSTWPGGSYQFETGTSMAAPHVTGAAALVKAAFPNASDLGIKTLLLSSVDPNASLASVTSTGGRLNVATAVTCDSTPKVLFDAPGAGFNVDVGTPISIAATASNCADPAGVEVSGSANGTAFSLTPRGDGLYTGSYTPATSGALTLSLTATAAGKTTTKTVTGVISQAVPIVPGGPAVTVTTQAADENARLTFDGQAGQRVSLKLSAVTISASYVSILNADATPVGGNAYVSIFGGFLDTRTLPATGRYTILVDPQGAATGSMTLNLYDVPTDLAGSVTPGASFPAAIGTPGQNARLTFTGQAGQRVSLKLAAGTIANSYVSILNPDGTMLGSSVYISSFGGFVDTRTLGANGTYTILVDPQDAAIGSTALSLFTVPADVTGSLAPGGPAFTAAIGTPGQNARLTFAGQAGRRISLKLGPVTIASSYVSILNPDGTQLAGNVYVSSSGGFVDTKTLPASGTYTVVADPQNDATGSMTLALFDVPPDVAGTMIAGGPTATFATTAPGQNARIAFDGRAGQIVSLKLSAVSIASSYVSILKPDGTALGGNAYVGTSGGFLDARTLPVAGSYTILLDPQAAASGSATLTLYDIPGDVSGTLTIGGPSLAASFTTPGQNGRFTFAGTAGQRVTLTFSGVSVLFSYFSVLNPSGSTLVSNTSMFTSGKTVTTTLPATGSYTIVVDPQSSEIGNMTLRLS